MIKVQIINPGDSKSARVDNEAVVVSDGGYPPFGLPPKVRVFRDYLRDDSGSNDMQVSTDTDFYVGAAPEKDRYITTLSFVIADASQTLSEFGNLNSALSNGCQLVYSDQDGEVTIADALQTNWDFIRLCQGNPSFGSDATAFRAGNVSGTSEGYIPVLDFKRVFGLPWGLCLEAGSEQRLTMRVRDTTTGVDQFDCIAYGFERAA